MSEPILDRIFAIFFLFKDRKNSNFNNCSDFKDKIPLFSTSPSSIEMLSNYTTPRSKYSNYFSSYRTIPMFLMIWFALLLYESIFIVRNYRFDRFLNANVICCKEFISSNIYLNVYFRNFKLDSILIYLSYSIKLDLH